METIMFPLPYLLISWFLQLVLDWEQLQIFLDRRGLDLRLSCKGFCKREVLCWEPRS